MSKPITFKVEERDDGKYRGLKIIITNPNLAKEHQEEIVDIAIEKINNRVSVLIPYLATCDFDAEKKNSMDTLTTYRFEVEGLKEDRKKLAKILEAFKILNSDEP